tara:strand:- start:147 stop:449 length:303 start_codon:yes stop_codon:yes gene_type:complete
MNDSSFGGVKKNAHLPLKISMPITAPALALPEATREFTTAEIFDIGFGGEDEDTVLFFDQQHVQRASFSFYRRYCDNTRVIRVMHAGDLSDDVKNRKLIV